MESALATLGLNSSADQSEIRSAFVRLARIYHPDRFAGMASDVIDEAERRMKEVSEAYRALRKGTQAPVEMPGPAPWGLGIDPMEEARRYRAEIEARRLEDEANRKRWAHWEELERKARERAVWESDLASSLARTYGSAPAKSDKTEERSVLALSSGESAAPKAKARKPAKKATTAKPGSAKPRATKATARKEVAATKKPAAKKAAPAKTPKATRRVVRRTSKTRYRRAG